MSDETKPLINLTIVRRNENPFNEMQTTFSFQLRSPKLLLAIPNEMYSHDTFMQHQSDAARLALSNNVFGNLLSEVRECSRLAQIGIHQVPPGVDVTPHTAVGDLALRLKTLSERLHSLEFKLLPEN